MPRQGFDVKKMRYKQALLTSLMRPTLKEVRLGNSRAIVYSPYDLTCGLDGHDCYNCLGPERNDALKMAANIVLTALPPAAPAAPAKTEQSKPAEEKKPAEESPLPGLPKPKN